MRGFMKHIVSYNLTKSKIALHDEFATSIMDQCKSLKIKIEERVEIV